MQRIALIRRCLIQRGVTRSARELGVPQATLWRFANGLTKGCVGLVERIEASGMVPREPDERDRALAYIRSLSPVTLAMCEEVQVIKTILEGGVIRR